MGTVALQSQGGFAAPGHGAPWVSGPDLVRLGKAARVVAIAALALAMFAVLLQPAAPSTGTTGITTATAVATTDAATVTVEQSTVERSASPAVEAAPALPAAAPTDAAVIAAMAAAETATLWDGLPLTTSGKDWTASVVDDVVSIEMGDATAQMATVGLAAEAEEWWTLNNGNLEQGWTFASEPAGANGLLQVAVEVTGDVTPSLVSDTVVRLDSATGTLWYRDLIAWDATGRALSATMNVAADMIGIDVVTLGADWSAVYPVVIDPIITEDQILEPGASSAQDRIGTVVDIDDTLAIATAPGDDRSGLDRGATYIYERNVAWSGLQTVVAPSSLTSGSGSTVGYGLSAKLHGDLLLVGAPLADNNGFNGSGAVVPYIFDGTEFVEGAPFFACQTQGNFCDAETANGNYGGARFGSAIDISGPPGGPWSFVIGAPGIQTTWLGFLNVGGTPTLEAEVTGTGNFGSSVALNALGTHFAVGTPNFNGGVGQVDTFIEGGSGFWDPMEVISADPSLLDGEFGTDIAYANDILAVGAPYAASASATANGYISLFAGAADFISNNAVEVVTDFREDNNNDNAHFGFSIDFAPVDADNAILAVGQPGPAATSLSSYVFAVDMTDPFATTIDPNNVGFANSTFGSETGYSVATDGDRWFTGAPNRQHTTIVNSLLNPGAGVVIVATVNASVNQLLTPDKDNAEDRYGSAVDIDGNIMAIGAPLQDSTNEQSGVVYVYARDTAADPWVLEELFEAPGGLAAGHEFGASVSINGDSLAIGAPTNTPPSYGEVFVWKRASPGDWDPVTVDPFTTITPAFGDGYARSILLTDGGLWVGAPGAGEVWLLEYVEDPVAAYEETFVTLPNVGAASMDSLVTGGTERIMIGNPGLAQAHFWDWDPALPFSAFNPAQFDVITEPSLGIDMASAVAIDDSGYAVMAAASTGGFVLMDASLTTVTTVGGLQPTTWDPALMQFETAFVDINDTTIALGNIDAAGGQVDLYAYDPTLGSPISGPFDSVQASTRQSGDKLGGSVALDDGSIAVGAISADNAGSNAGAVFALELAPPPANDPQLTFTLDLFPNDPSSVTVAGGVAASEFSGGVLQDQTDDESSIAAAPLAGTPLAGTPLAGTLVGDTPLAGVALDFAPLAGTSLIEIGIDGGWEAIIEGTDLENIPLVDLTLEDILDPPNGVAATRFAATPLAGVDVNGTPLAGVPLAGVVLGSIPLAGVPLAGTGSTAASNQEWCDLLNTFTDITCSGSGDPILNDVTVFEATVRGVPLAGVPLAGTPLAGTPLAGTPLAGVPVGSLNLNASPLAGVPLAGVPLAGVPLAGTPLAGTPLAGVPLLSTDATGAPLAGVPLAGVPLAGVPLAGVDVVFLDASGTPLAGVPLAGVPLAGTPLAGVPLAGVPVEDIPTSIPLAGTPLAGVPLAGTPLAGVPLAGVLLADTPLAGVPLAGTGGTTTDWCDLLLEIGGGYDCTNFVDVNDTTVLQLALNGVPLAGVPLAGVPLAGVPLAGVDISNIPLAGVPLAGVPLAGVPLAGVPLAGTPLAGVPLAGTSLGQVPLAGVDILGSPLAGVPLAGVPLAGTPLAGVPLAGTPLAGVPLAGVPLAGVPLAGVALGGVPLAGVTVAGLPLAGVPLAGVNVGNTPLAGVELAELPLAGVPLAGVGVDCDLVNCDIDTIGDAISAGAIDTATTLADLFPVLSGIRLGDLEGEFLGAYAAGDIDMGGMTLGDLLDLDDMVLADIPTDQLGLTVLEDLGLALATVSYADLVGAIINPSTGVPFDDATTQAALRSALDSLTNSSGPLNADDLEVFGNVTLGDFIGGTGTSNLTLADLGSILGLVEVQDVLEAFDPDATLIPNLDIDLGTLTIEQLQGLTLGDLLGRADFDSITVDQLFATLDAAGLLDGFTIGDLMLALVDAGQLPFGGLNFGEVEVGDLPDGTVPDVRYVAGFEVQDATENQTVEIQITLPTTASYIVGTGNLSDEEGNDNDIEPVIDGNTLTWLLPDTVNADQSWIQFSARPSVTLGASEVNGTGRIVGTSQSIKATQVVNVAEGLEPNDFPATTEALPDTVYLTYISTPTDVDVFHVDVAENDQLAVQLSSLTVDLDIALYVDPTDAATNAALSDVSDEAVLIPIKDPDQEGADSEPLQDFRRLDLEDADLSLLEVSNSSDTENEVIVTERLPAGRYYVQVFGANGAVNLAPAALQIGLVAAEDRPDCTARGALPAAAPSAGITFDPSANTAIVVNYQRMEQLYSQADRIAVENGVDNFVNWLETDPEGSQLGINPIVIPVDSFPAVNTAYQQWDNPANPEDACDPEQANAVVNAILDNAIDPIRDNIDHLVILGGDDMIPMARLSDATTVASEYDFRYEFVGDAAGANPDNVNAFTAVPWERRYLSDEPYGESAARDLGDRFLYVADIALGRLVETPDQILGALTHFETFDGSLDIQTAEVLGYDFLVDGSDEIAADLAAGGLIVEDELADGTNGATPWDRNDAIAAITGPTDVLSLNAHFDHYRALPASGDQVPGFSDNLETNDVFGGLLVDVVFSMGCHGGLSVSDLVVTNTNQDWAQTFAESQTVFVGNTGFGYGDTETVAYSEQLMALFAEEMVRPFAIPGQPASTTIGQALTFAKNRYVEDVAVFSVYDEKALMEATFYGLPFYQVGLAPTALPAPPTNTTATDATGIETLPLTLAPANSLNTVTSGGFYSNPDPDSGDDQVITVPGYPVQPSLSTDVSVVGNPDTSTLDQIAHGAIVLEMTSQYSAAGFDPVVADAVFDESGAEPELGDVVFPAKPITINNSTTPGGERQTLVVATGQFSSADSVQRIDDDIDVLVYYSDPAETDFDPPVISAVNSELANNTFTVTLDAPDATRVYVLTAIDPGPGATVDWVGTDLQNIPGTDRWSGSIDATGASVVEFMVQAVDSAGNVGFATNKARNFNEDDTPTAPPVTPDLTVTENPTNFNSIAGWFSGPATIDVSTTDPNGATYSVNGGTPVAMASGSSSFTVTDDGIHTYVVETATGNQIQSGTLRIDGSGNPIVTLSEPMNNTTYYPSEVPPLLFLCSDPSLVSCEATVDSAPFDNGATTLPTTAGAHAVEVLATDVFGNSGSAFSVYYVVEPTITATEAATNLDPSGLFTGSATVDVVTDDPQGAEYRVDVGPWMPLPTGASSFVVSGEGAHTWRVRTVSTFDAIMGDLEIDTLAPTATISSPLDGEEYEPATVPALSFSCADANLDSCTATVDGVSFADGASNLPSTPGPHVVEVEAIDAIGRSTTDTITYTVASVNAPVIVTAVATGPADPTSSTPIEITWTGDAGTTAVVDWGDGTSCSTPNANCAITAPQGTDPGTVTGTHLYSTTAVQTVTVTLTSPTGDATVETFTTVACTITGTNGNDFLWGTYGDDIICGFGGHDRIYGHSGDDIIYGGGGTDRIYGRNGDDIIYGGPARDYLSGASGDDTIYGEAGSDVIWGGRGLDTIHGGTHADWISGGADPNTLYGDSGNDIIFGSSSDDFIDGGNGNDHLFGIWGDDTILGGNGNDSLFGSLGDDTLDGGAQTDYCVGGWGSDTVINCE